jgi:Ca2+-binding RTX toxin-like protein
VSIAGIQTRTYNSKLAFSDSNGEHNDVQVDALSDASEGFLEFTAANWNIPQTVNVTAVDDDYADGQDAQVFVSLDQRVNRVRGPVTVEGGNRIGAEQFLNNPVMLPGENNFQREDGTITTLPESSIPQFTDANIKHFNPDTKQQESGFDERMNDYPYSITFLDGPLKGYAFEVANVTGTTITFKTAWPTIEGVVTKPAVGNKYFITAINFNLLVNENTQVDVLNVWNSQSPVNESMTLTASHLTGLGMGPDTVIGGQAFDGGITYFGLEAVNIHLGSGNQNVTVESTHSGETSIISGTGNDTIRVKTIGGRTFVNTGTGTDSVTVTSDQTTIDQITGLLTVAAAGTDDTLTIDDSADTNNNTGTLTSTTLTGLDMPSVAEVQTMRVQATGGSFKLSATGLSGDVTMNFGASAADVATALISLLSSSPYNAVAGDIVVTRVADGPNSYLYTVSFVRHLVGQDLPTLVWVEAGDLLTFTSEISKDVRISTIADGNTAPVRNNVQTLTVSAMSGSFTFDLLGTLVTIDVAHATKSILAQLQEQLDAILNPNNAEDFLPHTSNYSLRQIGNTYEIVFRGDQAAAEITSLNTTSLTGSAVLQTRMSGINYYGFNTLNLTLGSGNDVLNIQGTAAGSTNNINTAAGDDQIDMSSEADLTGTTDLIAGDVNLDAGSGTNRLLISDVADETGDANISLTRNTGTTTETLTLSGMADGDIRFSATGGDFNQGVTIFGGSAGNTFSVDGVFAGAPTVIGTGAGDDHLTLTSFTTGDGTLKLQGQDGHDVIDASAATKSLIIDGNAGNDAIEGGSANDTLRGGLGIDYIRGNAGNDTITGDNSHTVTVYGADTADVLATGAGDSDIIVGGSGNDTITSEGGNDIVFGDEGTVSDTQLVGLDSAGDGDDIITTGDGSDIVIGGLGVDTIRTETGDSIVSGGIASMTRDLGGLTIAGELASESAGGQIRLITSSDTSDGGDTITVTQGTNIILGGLGIDHITADGGINTVLGDNGQVGFYADGTLRLAKSIDLGNGSDDFITLLDGVNTVVGGAGEDRINIGGGTNVVLGDEGGIEVLTDSNGDATGTTVIESLNDAIGDSDLISVGPGVNIVVGGASTDTITVLASTPTSRAVVLGDSGSISLANDGTLLSAESSTPVSGDRDIINLTSGVNTVIGGAGNDAITAGVGTNTILGDDGKATFFTNGELKSIESTNPGSGDVDTITLEDGTNTVIAGAGNDIVNIGGGTNIVLGDEGALEVLTDVDGFKTGTTVIGSLNDANGGEDEIEVGPGVNIVVGGAGTDTITVLDSTPTSRATVLGDSGTMTLENEGTLLSIESSTPVSGARDIINLTSGVNTVIGGAGNDEITAGAGTNTILGDDGKATFFANGVLKSIESTNLGSGDNDTITLQDGVNNVIAGAGNDTITMGGGTNFAFGDEGKLEVLADGSGTTEINSLNGNVGGEDTINVGSGYNVIGGGADTDTITVNGTTSTARGIVLGDNGRIVLDTASGTLLSIESTDFAAGARDVVNLTAGTNAVIGGAGNDEINAGAGRNTILGDDGKATFFANGDLRLIESINLGNGSDDTITLQDGVNNVIAGAGNDTITMGGGTNFAFGDEGKLEVLTDGSGTTEINSLNGTVGGLDTINVGSGYNVIGGGANTDTITVNGTTTTARGIVLGDNGRIVLDTATGTLLSIESTDFAAGARDVIQLTAGTNAVIGGAGNDEITAGAGSNTILGDDGKATFFASGDLQLIESINLGNGGDDIITLQDGVNNVIAGAGNDTITMGGGTNFAFGDEGKLEVLTDGSGTTEINSLNGTVGGLDTINVGSGYNVIGGGANTDTITVNGTTSTARGIVLGDNGRIVLDTATGTLLSIESTDLAAGARDVIQLTAGTNAVIGGAGNDEITAGAGNNTILGDDGKATFFANGDLRLIESINLGNGGDDTITLQDGVNNVIAGAGNDTITMGGGTNFAFGDEGKLEVLTDGSGTTEINSLNGTVGGLDTINVGSGYNVIGGGANTDTITVNGTTTTARGIVLGDNGRIVLDTATGTLLSIESTDFAAGARDVIQLTAGTNAVIGGAGNDEITAGAGNNTILGDDGKATFFANGDLRLIESINLGNGGDDTITLQDGVNNVIAGAGNDTITMGGGTNFAFGDEGKLEVLTDGSGTTEINSLNGTVGGLDTINVGSGYNVIGGGANTDTITVNGTTSTARGIVLGDNGRIVLDTATGTLLSIESTDFAAGARDVIQLTAGTNAVIGGAGNDEINAGAGNNTILGDDGKATFFANGDLRLIESINLGNGGDDTITLQDGVNSVLAGAGDDIITMGAGRNFAFGDEGKLEVLNGGTTEINSLNGNVGGEDTITVGSGYNVIGGGANTDTITVNGTTTTARGIVLGDNGRIVLDTATGTLLSIESTDFAAGARDVINLTAGTNAIIGGAGNDEITATTGRNTVLGDDGHATFYANGDLEFIESINLGNGGNDTISLQSGINAVIAGAGNDSVSVTDGTNVILGDEGEARLYTDGNVDEIRSTNPGVGGTDTITLGNGTNIVIAGAGGDNVTVGAGTATILGDEGQSFVTRDVTTHVITAHIVETTNDAVGGNDSITATGANSIVMGGAGSDTITGTSTGTALPPKFIVLGDAGRAEFNGSGQLLEIFTKSADTGAGDTISLENADDVVLGGDGGDTIDAAEGTNIVLGDHGHASFDISGQLRTIYSTDTASGGDDTINIGSDNDIVFGGFGKETLTANGGDNIILGDAGQANFAADGQLLEVFTTAPTDGDNDNIATGLGNDLIMGGTADDTITDAGGHNVILGDSGSATFDTVGHLRDVHTTANSVAGNDTISTGTGNDIILGGSGNDQVSSTNGDNIVLGDNGQILFDANGLLVSAITADVVNFGNDTITLTTGNDIVLGGSGVDVVNAGNGNNIVLGDNGEAFFNTARILIDFNTTDPDQGNNDTISVGTGDDIVIGGAANDNITAAGGRNVLVGDNARILFDAVGNLVDVTTKSPTVGGDDVIISGTGNDVIFGGSANDTITDAGGRNIVVGDNGHATFDTARQLRTIESIDTDFGGSDNIATGSGDDVILGGNAGDTITAGNGRNIIVGDHGTAVLDATGILRTIETIAPATGGNDTISSGTGNDVVFGGAASDTVTIAGGNNIVVGDNGVASFDATGTLRDIATQDASIGGDDVINTGSGNDVVFAGAANDSITIAAGNNIVVGDNGVASFDVAGTLRDIATQNPSIGGNDVINTGNGHDVIFGGAANDTVNSTGGHNVILGDNGQATFSVSAVLLDVTATDPSIGGSDNITSGAGNDLIIAGTGSDTVSSGAGNDLIFGDHGRVTGSINLTELPLNTYTPVFTFTSIATQNSDLGGDDLINAGADDDIIIGGQGIDRILGGSGDDDIIGGHTVADGQDSGDWLDGGSGNDYIAGDNAYIHREPRTTDTRFRTLVGSEVLGVDGNGVVTTTTQLDPSGTAKRTITLFNHTTTTVSGVYGNDAIAGGSGNDTIFGQLGNDAIQGDGAVVNAAGTMVYNVVATLLSTDDIDGPGTDGDDYIEGGGGNDTILGNLGQDDIIGGSSILFGTPTAADRPDGSDVIFGGSGTRAGRNDLGDESLNGHARDADVILGDNGNIFRLVGINGIATGGYLRFNYDTYGPLHIIPRTIQYLEYAFGDTNNNAFSDVIHGEAGDDVIHGMSGNDVLFGDAQDDDIVGGAGNDRISGGAGEDGILGDDGRILTSRNGLTEPLRGITNASVQQVINLPNTVIGAVTNVTGRLKKTADLASYRLGGHDVIYGGLGDDFLHGGFGDDAISGAEATAAWYITTPLADASVLQYNEAAVMFAAYNPLDALSKIPNFILNFNATDANGSKIDDGIDSIFGDEGNDWLVGGTNTDRMFGGMGGDLLNADDNLETNGGLNNTPDALPFADGDWAFGGGGFDVLIGNTGADRLIDWSKRFNTYVMPAIPTAANPTISSPTILRDPSPILTQFLLNIAVSSGYDSNTDTLSNEYYAELGLVTNEDGIVWFDQQWQQPDRDPAPTNVSVGVDTLGGYETLPAAGIRVVQTTGINVSEYGTTNAILVALTSPPTSNVVLTITSQNSIEVLVSTSSLTFTPLNWYIPQGITVQGVDDIVKDGHKPVNVTIAINTALSPAAWSSVTEKTVVVTNLDNELSIPKINGPAPVTAVQRPTITWTNDPGAAGYQVWIKNVSTGQDPYLVTTSATNSFTPSQDLGVGLFEIWVRSYRSDGIFGGWSAKHSTQINTPVAVVTPAVLQSTLRPTLTWAPVVGAARYEMWINNVSTGQDPAINESNVTTTEWTPSSDLPIGAWRVWVRAIDLSGRTAQWSSAVDFQIAPPVTMTPIAAIQTNPRPAFTWTPLAGAVRYDVWINNLTTGQNQVVRDQNVTSPGWTPTTDMPISAYRIWVRAIDISGRGTLWSAAADFRIVTPPTPIAPTVATLDRTPTFTWTAVAGAVSYKFELRNVTTGAAVYKIDNLTTPTHTAAANLAAGNYRWWAVAVGANSLAGYWSVASDFTIPAPAQFTTPSGTLSATPTFNWLAVPAAVRYEIQIDRIDVPQVNVVRVTNVVGTSFTSPTTLVSGGSYRIWIRAISAAGDLGLWSSALNFNVAATDPGNKFDQTMEFASLDLLENLLAELLDDQALSANETSHSAESDVNSSEQLPVAAAADLMTDAELTDIDNLINSIVTELLIQKELT